MSPFLILINSISFDIEFHHSVASNRTSRSSSFDHLSSCLNNNASSIHLSTASVHFQSSRSVFLSLCRLLHSRLSRQLLHQFVHGTDSLLSPVRYTHHLSPEDRVPLFRSRSDAPQSTGGYCLHHSLYKTRGSRSQSHQYLWRVIDLFCLRSREVLHSPMDICSTIKYIFSPVRNGKFPKSTTPFQ